VHEVKVPSEPEALVALFRRLGVAFERVGLEVGTFVAVTACRA
jgi:hypothetical protein